MAVLAVELATAYVSLIPSMQGAQGAIASQLTPAATAAGTSAGAAGGAAMGTTMRTTLMRYLGPAALFAGVGLAAKGLYGIGDTWKDVTNTVRTGTGAQGEALDGLVGSVKNVAKTVPAEIGDVGTAVADLNTRLGLTGPTLETVASQYLEAGRILGEDVDIAKTTAAFNAFGIEGDDVVGAMDRLFQVSQATGAGVNDLAGNVKNAAPVMQNLGFSFEETASLAGNLDKAGLNATGMMSGLSMGLVRLAKDGEDPADAFARTVGEIEGFLEAGDRAAAIDLAGQVFGTRNATQFIGAVQDGALALDDLAGVAGITGDTILGVGEETQTFAEKWQIVKNNASAALEPLGTKVFDALGDALASAMPYFNALADWLGNNEWALGVLATLIGVVLVGAFWALTAPIWATTAALLANPITWIVVGIVALIAALVLLIANWDAVVEWLKGVWDGIVDWLAGIWDSITEGISTAWNAIADFFSGLWDSITSRISAAWNAIADFLSGLWGSIRSTIEARWNAIVDWVKGIPGRFLDGLRAIGNIAGDIARWVLDMRDKVVEKFNSIIDWVKDVPNKVLNALGDLSRLLVNAGKNIMDGLLGGIRDGFENVKNFVGGIGDWIADNKGPKDYDLALLQPAGGWIMQGLQAGIESEIPSLRRTLGRVTDELKLGASVSSSGARRAGAMGVAGSVGGERHPAGPFRDLVVQGIPMDNARATAEEIMWQVRTAGRDSVHARGLA